MILELNIENFILIDQLKLEFSDGLNIFTGETGAGKSMIIGAINACLGSRVSKDVIRYNKKKAVIQIVFTVDSEYVRNFLEELDVDSDIIVITREITEYKSMIRLNDKIITLSTLKSITPYLIDIHGQHEQSQLLYPKNHIQYLDEKGDISHKEKLKEVRDLYLKIKEIDQRIEEMMTISPKDYDIDYIEFQINEIDELNLNASDDELLEEKHHYYKNIQLINNNVSSVKEIISETIKDHLDTSLHLLREIKDYDKKLLDIYTQLEGTMYEIEDINHNIVRFIDDIEVDEEEMMYIENRMDKINTLKLKHGNTIKEILEKRDDLTDKIKYINEYNDRLNTLKNEKIHYTKEYIQKSKILSESRKKIKINFVSDIQKELQFLNMENTVFDIDISIDDDRYKLSKDGIDTVEFLIKPATNLPFHSLAKIASGGELSRIMLAMKIVLNRDNNTLIFDEIDSGISGRTAIKVGDKIKELSSTNQILCITHLPQISTKADRHFLIEKGMKNNEISTRIYVLNNEDKLKETARLLSGNEEDLNSLMVAKNMLNGRNNE